MTQHPQLVQLAAIAPTRWKNGGGLTRDLLCWPNANDWLLRLSIAEVNQDGPFSAYPGVARSFAVLQGAGVVLHFAAGPLTLTPDSPPLHFDGTLAPACTLVDGATLDLNLMARHGAGRATLERAHPGLLWACGAPLRGVFTLHGATLHGAGPAPLALPAGTLAYTTAAPCGAWQLGDTADGAASNWWLSFNPRTR